MRLTPTQMINGMYNTARNQLGDVTGEQLRSYITNQVTWAFEQLGNPATADMYELDQYLVEYAETTKPKLTITN